MGAVVVAPRRRSTYDRDARANRAETEVLHRKQTPPTVTPPFCVVSPEPVEAWPVGTLWMNTSTVGPLRSHPLYVKLEGGGWDHVAWMVPV